MRIVDRKTFLAMPEGTLFSKYQPCVFEDLLIKGESLENDFFYQSISGAIDSNDSGEFVDLLDKAKSEGVSLAMDFECEGQDGLFDDDQLFAVWERADVEKLIARIQAAFLVAYYDAIGNRAARD